MAPTSRRNNKSTSSSGGGLKGFFTRAGKSFYTGGVFASDKCYKVAEKLCKLGFIFATVCMVAYAPLVFEIAREGQMIESEKLQVGELRNQGYSDMQLRELGYSGPSIARAPSVLLKK
mmetsp:Transcript_22196/g.28026  ORF Transcript_22196/g.28026 Transcript_22196/m.28026 type:complete len:118 (-) Transcript_22196:398-751(-)